MSYNALEIEFIEIELDDHVQYLTDLMEEDIIRKGLIKHGHLLNAIRGDIATITKRGNSVVLSLKFPDYGRFIEIQKHKKRIRTESTKGNSAKWSKKQKKKDTGWYSRNAYGSLNRLIGRLMYGFSEEIKKNIKESLDLQKK